MQKVFLIKYGTVSRKRRNIYESKEVSSSWNDSANASGDYLWDAEILQIPRQEQTVVKNVKITIFQSKIEANEGYKKLIAAYEKDHPNVEINLEAVTGNDFGASMKAKMQSDPPTIFSVGGFFGHERLRRCY